MAKLAVVVPTYNSESFIRSTLKLQVSQIGKVRGDYVFIVVDDASSDGTWEILEDIAAQDSRVSAVRLASNVGQQAAIFAGLSLTHGMEALVMDDDTLAESKDFALLLDPITTGEAEVVVATSPPQGQKRRSSSRTFWAWMRFSTRGKIRERELTLRALSLEGARLLADYPSRNITLTQAVFDLGLRKKTAVLSPNFHRLKSRHSSWSRLSLFIEVFLSFRRQLGYLLLATSAILAAFFPVVTLLLFAFKLIDFSNPANVVVAGMIWLSWVISLAIFGLQSLQIGLLLDENLKRPKYRFRQFANNKELFE
jgi:glycosyltransferase involved in cell wall biosynthesis